MSASSLCAAFISNVKWGNELIHADAEDAGILQQALLLYTASRILFFSLWRSQSQQTLRATKVMDQLMG